jgi:segregation and condensation protein A
LDIHIAQYEGPLDLLLDLIRKQQINIYDIPIASITAQYLEYMQRAIAMDIELSSEFVYMAATLIHIKSRTLLPRDPERFKNAAEMLQQKRMVEEAVWSNPRMGEFLSEDEAPALAVTLFDLVKTFQQVLDRTRNRPTYEVGSETISVPEMIRYLRGVLKRLPASQSLSATDLFEQQRSQRAMICLFLAILELVKMQAVALTQKDAFGDIGLQRTETFDETFGSEEALAAIEQDYD